jgi:hypothetical protein
MLRLNFFLIFNFYYHNLNVQSLLIKINQYLNLFIFFENIVILKSFSYDEAFVISSFMILNNFMPIHNLHVYVSFYFVI